MTAAPQTSQLAETVVSTGQLVPSLRSAAAAACVAFGLSFPIISYHAEVEHQQRARARRPLAAFVRDRGDRLRFRFPAPDGAGRLAHMVRPHRLDRRRRHGRRAGAGGARGRGRRATVVRPDCVRALFRPFRAGPPRAVPAHLARPARAGQLAEVDQQLRHPDHDLRDAGLGIEHRGRPRRPP